MVPKSLAGVRLLLPKEIPETELYGYDLEVNAGLGIALSVIEGGERRVLVFGLPGSGVGAFPRAIAWKLNSAYQMPFSLLHVACEEIILEFKAREVITSLIQWQKKIESRGNMIIHLQRPEALTPKFENFHGTKAFANLWLSSFLGRRYNKILLFCTTDNPKDVDFSLLRSFKTPIYLKPADLASLSVIIKSILKRGDYDRIAGRLYRYMENANFKLVSAEVVNACRDIAASVENIKDLPVDKVVSLLKDRVFPCYPSRHVKEYEEINARLISFSTDFVVGYWSKKLEDYEKKRPKS